MATIITPAHAQELLEGWMFEVDVRSWKFLDWQSEERPKDINAGDGSGTATVVFERFAGRRDRLGELRVELFQFDQTTSKWHHSQSLTVPSKNDPDGAEVEDGQYATRVVPQQRATSKVTRFHGYKGDKRVMTFEKNVPWGEAYRICQAAGLVLADETRDNGIQLYTMPNGEES
jgi:hypothetical protein